ncbi:DMT family transporter [Treponema sp. OMZ 840]|uniref:DMT family transporter n=1 Tax=Treponema sp. OMZ 840 TaxID=244313 RepID=UPI003D8D09C3
MSQKIKSHLFGFFAAFFFAWSFPLSRIALEQFSPYSFSFLRCLFASIVLLAIGKYNRIRLPFRAFDVSLFFFSGAMGFGVYLIILNIGLKTVSAATSSIIISTTPIMTAFAASFFYKEKISAVGVASIISAFVGVLIIILWTGVFSFNAGIFWVAAAAVLFCGYNILNRRLAQKGYSSMEIVTHSIFCGSLMLMFFLPQSYRELRQADTPHIAVLLFLSIFTTALGYFLFSKGIQIAEKTSDVTNYMFIIPLFASILGYFILDERLNTGTAIGGSIIAISIIIFALKGRPKNRE